ncbi:MAG: glycosyltransferase family 4 protein [Pseudomonadota bacterium]
MPERPRVLVIAEAANPEWVSVPLVGWSLAVALREAADVHIVTQIRNREAIIRAGLVEGEDFTAIDSEALARPAYRLAEGLRLGRGVGWTIVTALQTLSYPYFERLVWRRFGEDIRAGRFDIVHRVTPLSPTTVSPIAARCRAAGVPFVMGPINGGIPWPPGFEAVRRAEREWLSKLRGLHRLLPGRQRMLRATALILAGSRHTAAEIPPRYAERVLWLPENGIDPARFNREAAQDGSGPLRAAFVGRLVPYKGPDMLLEAALPLLKDGRMRLDILGDGPLMAPLRAQVVEAGVEAAVRLHGNIAHAEVQDMLAAAEVLAFPSVREFGGGVVLEAMALGVVPIVVDYGGPAELVDESCGIKIPLSDRQGVIAGTRAALQDVLAARARLPAMAATARARVAAHFTWAEKARQVSDAYDRVLSGGPVAGTPLIRR